VRHDPASNRIRWVHFHGKGSVESIWGASKCPPAA
jgi:hypothetical protein